MQYLSHPKSVLTQTSCIRFMTMRATHPFVLRQFWERWFLSYILTPGPDFDHTFPLKGFWTHKSLWLSIWASILFCFQVLSTDSTWKVFSTITWIPWHALHCNWLCPSTTVLWLLLTNVLSVLGRLPTFPLRIKSLFRTLRRQQNQLSNGCKTSYNILSQAQRKHQSWKQSIQDWKWCQQNLLFFKQTTVASHTSSKYMVFSKSNSKSINIID